MRDLTFVLLHYSAIFLLALLSYVFGSCLTRRIEYKSVLEQISFSVTLGLGYIAYLIMLLGLLGFIYSWVVLIVFLIGLSICFTVEYDRLRNLRRTRRERETSGKRPHRWALGVAAIFLIALSLHFLAPPLYLGTNATDATSSHLACAKMFVQNHGLVFTPNLRYPVFPSTNNMLFTLALLFYDEILAQLVEFLMLVMLTMSLMAFGKRFFSKRAAV